MGRIILLRLLVSWWAIPFCWVVLLPPFMIIGGRIDEEIAGMRELSKYLWTGK